jgi:pimeloyl-ACP methyl ester carboxylesterase
MTLWHFEAADGVRLAVHETGEGRPVVLIHGYCSDAETNWIKYGPAALLAENGFRVIMPDLRGHGQSDRPHDPGCYPPDVLADDALALVRQLGLSDYDLGGYSLGARTVARMLVRGAQPSKAIMAGMGLKGLTDTQSRTAHFRNILTGWGEHPRGSPEWMAEAFIKTTGGDRIALDRILDTFVDTDKADLAAMETPIGVLCGVDDDDNGSAEALADLLPNGQLITIPGNHMSAVTRREFGAAILAFLASE